MSERVLYFPYIQVPDSAWFSRMLLYWDSVGTMIPSEFMQRPEDLGEHTRGLLEAELVTGVIPGMHLYRVSAFDTAFSHFLDELGTELDDRRRGFAAGDVVQVHVEKVGLLEHVLRECGLAADAHTGGYSPWYLVERRTADDFMAYLAACLGRLEEVDHTPVTDDVAHCAPMLRAMGQPVEHRPQLGGIRLDVLDAVLPAPRRSLTPRDLADFKDRHGALLPAFRRQVEREVLACAALPDPELRQRRLALFRDEVDEQVREIQARLEERGWGDVVLGKLLPVIAAVPGVSALPGLASAVHNAFSPAPQAVPPSPLMYAAYANIELALR